VTFCCCCTSADYRFRVGQEGSVRVEKADRQLSWGARFAIAGILAVIVGLIMGAYMMIEQKWMRSALEKQLFGMVNTRTIAKAKQVSCETAFEIAAKLPEEVESIVNAFAADNEEVHGVAILDSKKEIIHEYRNRIGQPKKLITNLTKKDAQDHASATVLSNEKLAVAVSPVIIHENEVSAYVLYAESLSDYFVERHIANIFGIGMIFVSVIIVFASALVVLVYFDSKRS